jgi:hypothetical protein
MRTRLTAGVKPNRKRMATLACVYDAEPSPRRPHVYRAAESHATPVCPTCPFNPSERMGLTLSGPAG